MLQIIVKEIVQFSIKTSVFHYFKFRRKQFQERTTFTDIFLQKNFQKVEYLLYPWSAVDFPSFLMYVEFLRQNFQEFTINDAIKKYCFEFIFK